MGNQYNTVFFPQREKHLLNFGGRKRVECGGGFIAQDKLGFNGQTAGQAKPLLLPYRQPDGWCFKPVFNFFPQAHSLQLVFHDLVKLPAPAYAV